MRFSFFSFRQRLPFLLRTTEDLLQRLFPLFLVAGVMLYGFSPQIVYCDIPWHLAQAQWMVDHFQIYRHDLFNYPNLNTPMINEYPFYQAVLWLVYRVGGEYGAATVCALSLLILFGLYFRTDHRLGSPSALTGAALFAAVPICIDRMTFRPELITSLGIVFFMTFLLDHRRETDWKKFWPLVLFQVLWTNSHSGFIVGVALVFGFAVEQILRSAGRGRKEVVQTARTWLPVCLMVGLSCLVNPFGWRRLLLPFYHEGNGVIRAYVSEMQPMVFDIHNFFFQMMVLQLAIMFIAFLLYHGQISWAFLIVTLIFFREASHIARHCAVFGLLAPGVVLSSRAFGRPLIDDDRFLFTRLLKLIGLFVIFLGAFLVFSVQVTDQSELGLVSRWHAFRDQRVEYPVDATDWMRQHNIQGRLLHRSEIGGWLQYQGYNHGETYCDTGFGKFSEAFIHEIGLSCERPDYMAWLMKKYHPDFAVIGMLGYNWPRALIAQGWRCVFYAPNGSVWTRPGNRPDLRPVTAEQIATAFNQTIQQHGIPVKTSYYYSNLLTLQSMGLEDFALSRILEFPKEETMNEPFWQFVKIFCFNEPGAAPEHIEALYQLACNDPNRDSSLIFRSKYLVRHRRFKKLISLYEDDHQGSMNDSFLIDLAEAYTGVGDHDQALDLLRRSNLFDVNNGRRWQLLAEEEQQAGNFDYAAAAWKNALFFYPDDASIRGRAAAFAGKRHDPKIAQLVTDIERAR